MTLADSRAGLVTACLEAAVPLAIAELRDEPFSVRQRVAAEAGLIVASQADTMMFGSKRKPGAAARELERHRNHVRPVTREVHDKCDPCRNGMPDYSAGEVFSYLAKGLAALACQPGGVTFLGLHWCVYSHPWCPNAQTGRRPGCCLCSDDCRLHTRLADQDDPAKCSPECHWCKNGCPAADTEKSCCKDTIKPKENTMENTEEKFEGWAILVLMGHRRLAGYLTTQEIAGQAFLRIDVPSEPPATQLYSAGAVYCITPTTEETARQAAGLGRVQPVSRWELPQPVRADDAYGDPVNDGDEADGKDDAWNKPLPLEDVPAGTRL